MKKLVIFGASDMARLASYYFECDSEYTVVAYTADRKYCESTRFLDLPLIPFDELEANYTPDEVDVFVAVSYASMNAIRTRKLKDIKRRGYSVATYVSSKCNYLSQFKPGENCFILEDNTIQPYVKIGSNVWLWSGNHIGHDSVIEDNVYIASHVVISGFCTIGSNSFLGVNCTLRDGLTIGRGVLIGAGAIVMKDIEDKGVIVPAKSIVLEKKSDQLGI